MKRTKASRVRYGGISALVTVMILAALVAVNIGAAVLEKKQGWRRDYSFNAITTQSGDTLKILDRLEHPVHILALFRRGEEDAPLIELLDRYAAASPLVTWEKVDPALNPTLSTRYAQGGSLDSGSMIVTCEDTGRWRILGPQDYVSLGMDTETGEYTYTGWTYERSLTSAIDYVSRERVPKVVILQGHGELDGETLANFDGLLTANQYEVMYAKLNDGSYTPDPQDLLILFSPQRDLTEAEMRLLTDFAAKGGSFLFTCDYTDPVEKMPNLAALLRSYGFIPLPGIVVADVSKLETYYDEYPITLRPEMCSCDLTIDLIASGANDLLLPGCRAFEEPEESDRNLTTVTVLRSGEGSYLKDPTEAVNGLQKAEGDREGPFALALEARRITEEGYLSRAFAIGCSPALTDAQVYSMTDIQPLMIRVMEFLLDMNATDLDIQARAALRPALRGESTGLGSVLLVALPCLVLLAALLVVGPRKYR